MRKIRHAATQVGRTAAEICHLVKLYIGTEALYDGLGVELYIGDHKVRKYAQFKGGIYFKVMNSAQAAALRGQRVRFRRPGSQQFIDTGVDVPVEGAARRSLAAALVELPTQEEALRE